MKYFFLKILFLFALALCLYSKNMAQDTKAPVKNARLVIYDSLTVGGNAIYMTDYDRATGLFLGYDYYTYDIVMFDMKGEIIKHFNEYGEGPEEYDHSNSMTVKYWGQNSVVVRTNNKLKFYSFDGEFLGKTITNDGASIAPRRQMFIYQDRDKDTNTNLVYYADVYSSYPMNEVGFYEDTSRKVIVNYDLSSGKAQRYIGFEKSSVYLNGEEYYPDILPVFSLNYEKRLLDVGVRQIAQIYVNNKNTK